MAIVVEEKKPGRDEIPAGKVLCEYCVAKCCRYFALAIEEPKTWEDFEFLRWYLLHDRASLFTEDDSWYLMVHTDCKHLMADNRCGIYETRPQICRDYTTDDCEYEDMWTYEHYFETPEQITEYCEAVFKDKNDSNFRTSKPELLPILQ